MKTFYIHILLGFSILLVNACTTSQYVANPYNDARVIPNSNSLSIQKGNIIINAKPSYAPTRYGSRTTTIEVAIINPTRNEVEFYPKDFLLFDQYDRQYYPINRTLFNDNPRSNRPEYEYGIEQSAAPTTHHWRRRWGAPPTYDSYEGTSSANKDPYALSLDPMIINPHGTVTGNLYFPVSPNDLEDFQLLISRFRDNPTGRNSNRPSIQYVFKFHNLR